MNTQCMYFLTLSGIVFVITIFTIKYSMIYISNIPLPSMPSFPQIPSLSHIPQIPQIPNHPEIPEIPEIPPNNVIGI